MPRLALSVISLLAACVAGGAQAQEPVSLAVGASVEGTLGPGDPQLPSGEYFDQYLFEGEAGTTYAIRMSSESFDTYLIFLDPQGKQEDNDDFDGTDSGLDVTLAVGGECQIGATSYSPGTTGAYTLSLTLAEPSTSEQESAPPETAPAAP